MKIISFKSLIKLLYTFGFIFVLAMLMTGLSYYMQPLSERPHSPMHDQLKPAGFWGHGMGVIGTAMILLLLLYSVRKRGLAGIRFWSLRRWLDVHILFGIMGPLLITLHTAMKFHGIVSISYFSMLAVALSGVFGRYIYMQIPRDARGHALGLEGVRDQLSELQKTLVEKYGASPPAVEEIQRFASAGTAATGSKIRSVFVSLKRDITLNRRAHRLKHRLTREDRTVPRETIDEVINLARESSLLQRRLVLLDTMSELLHHWHVFHKPFAYVMLFIMVLHVGVTVAFGYKWIF
jgi:hypothetical protein